MAVNLVSPGVNIREVDLTLGRIDQTGAQIAAIAGPFEKGPINIPTLISDEKELIEVFGKPKLQDDQNEYWYSASNFLSYGGKLRIIRVGNSNSAVGRLYNANTGVSSDSTELRIFNPEDYDNNHRGATSWYFAVKTPGSWANNLKVCIIDNFADQIISGISTTSVTNITFVGVATASGNIGITTTHISGITTSGIAVGQTLNTIPGVIGAGTTVTSIGIGTVFINPASLNSGTLSGQSVSFGSNTFTTTGTPIQVGYAITQFVDSTALYENNVRDFRGYLRGLITGIGNSEIYVKVQELYEINENQATGELSPEIIPVQYKSTDSVKVSPYSFNSSQGSNFYINDSVGGTIGIIPATNTIRILDWYDNQTLDLTDSSISIPWKSIAPKPGTSQYSAERNGKNDEIHIVVVDESGSITGISANIVEKYTNLSKSIDARISPSRNIYYKDFIENNSQFIYAGAPEPGVPSGLVGSGINTSAYTTQSSTWGKVSQSNTFNVVGSKSYTLTGGSDYSGVVYVGGFESSTAEVISGYQLLSNPAEYTINYIMCGPSGGETEFAAQAKANTIISIAEQRKDCIALISAYKDNVLEVNSPVSQTENIKRFFSNLSSSSYAVFDSGYKYTFDRFNSRFFYMACNSDVAGTIARTALNNQPWFSPAGSVRGTINNTIKLAYNPNQGQRDQLYTNRINPIISNSGSGFILFGDKTALSYASAFDRINVRMLFLTIEKSIEQAARAQLFEFNDAITRSNFINIVEPYLRDVRAKRGITEFLVVCDETNNTPDIIDSNQFKADIFVKPARSINFIGLTFVATRTGVSFSEVVGTV